MNTTSYIDHYEKQLNERKLALVRTLAAWWIASTKGKDENAMRERVKGQINQFRAYLDDLEQELDKAEVTS
jgi:hypothetical protein